MTPAADDVLTRKELALELDGVTIGLRLDFRAIELIQQETGQEFLSAQSDVSDLNCPHCGKLVQSAEDTAARGKKLDARETIAIVTACAAAFDEWRDVAPRWGRAKIAGLLGLENFGTANRAVAQLIVANLPTPDRAHAKATAPTGAQPTPDPTRAPS